MRTQTLRQPTDGKKKAAASKQASPPATATSAQQAFGNHAVARVGVERNDPFEREADQTAEEVMRMPERTVQRMSEEQVHAKAEPVLTPSLSAGFLGRFESLRGNGEPLPESERAFFEPRFGRDFGGVRVHSGPGASELAQSVQARAFTFGDSIVFGAGYGYGTTEGRRVLAHELTHVVQQSGDSKAIHRKPLAAQAAQPDAGRTEVLASIEEADRAVDDFFSRYRIWLTRNMIQLLAAALQSGKGEQALAAIKGGFEEDLLKEAVSNTIASGIVEAGAPIGSTVLRYFVVFRTAKTVGGVFSFVIGTILEALIGNLFDDTSPIVQATADQIDSLVNDRLNPMVDRKRLLIRDQLSAIRRDMGTLETTAANWDSINNDLVTLRNAAESALLNPNDLSLYHEARLIAGLYEPTSLPAKKAPQNMTLHGTAKGELSFAMQHTQVNTGKTKIAVDKDGASIILRLKSDYCEGFGESDGPWIVDLKALEAERPYLKSSPPGDEFDVSLYSSGTFFESDLPISRVFHVGENEYATWYNVPKGVYMIEMNRAFAHPIGICAKGEYSVQ